MDNYLIKEGVEILVVASCYRNQDKPWYGPLSSNADYLFTKLIYQVNKVIPSKKKYQYYFQYETFILSVRIMLFPVQK